MNLDLMNFYQELSLYIENESELQDFIESIQFKINKNYYHYNNILKLLELPLSEIDDFTNVIKLPLYYESESLLISMRSTVDMLLHLIRFLFQLDLPNQEIYLKAVYLHKKLPKIVKNVFDRYTRIYNNPTWNFIYTLRNEIIHEKSILQVIPLDLDFFVTNETTAFLTIEDEPKEIKNFFGNCVHFLDAFIEQMFSVLKASVISNAK